jgi:type IV pilus assembly protein PilW
MSALILHRREAGMSLVELMVAMLIGLIGIVIITHIYITNDRYKRSTTGAGEAQVNGAIALYTIEREVRGAGYGFNQSAALNCKCVGLNCSPLQFYYNNGNATNSTFPPAPAALGALTPRTAAPVLIVRTPGAPDTITVLYGGANERMLPTQLTEVANISPYGYKVAGTEGFAEGNLILVAQNQACFLKQVSRVTPGNNLLDHQSTAFTSGSPLPFNPAASFGPALDLGTAVFSLGTPGAVGGPVWRTFFIANNQLQSEDILTTLQNGVAAPQQLVDDIVDLQAQYGRDDASAPGSVAEDGIVDTWDAAPPTDPADPTTILWRQVIAVRVGLLARSKNFEKPSVAGGACEATPAAPAPPPTWSGGAFTVPGGLPSCYKHRVFETVIPLRNLIWRPT